MARPTHVAYAVFGCRCPTVFITGSLSPQMRGCRQLYADLTKSRQSSGQRWTPCEFVLISGVANVIAEKVSLKRLMINNNLYEKPYYIS